MSSYQSVPVNQTVLLRTLLPSTTYTLAYCLPLLFASLLLTFAGAFLTLDRSRAFSPSYESLPGQLKPKKKFHWYLEGGVGGLAAGYVFGVHLSTFLSLMITSLTSSEHLTDKSFLAVWVLSALATALPCGRWRYCARAVGGIIGGATFALSVSVIIHPSLLARIILVAIALPLLTILTLLPFSRYQHGFLRFSLSAAGAFGVVLSISLAAGIESWAEVWERLWVADGPAGEWSNSKERGMGAAYCFLLAVGIASDWLLRRQFGENPDQKWDSYLADYSQNLPGRAGHFQPLTSIWTRLFTHINQTKSIPADDTAFPFQADLKHKQGTLLKLNKPSSLATPYGIPAFPSSPTALTKGRSQRTRKKMMSKSRNHLKFGGDQSGSDSESDPDAAQRSLGSGNKHVGMVRPLAGLMALDYDDGSHHDVEKEMAKVKAGFTSDSPDYSDYEDDVTSALKDREATDWSPQFLRHDSASGGSSTSQRTAVNDARQLVVASTPASPGGAVPITPSLINALDRLAVAQHEAFGTPSPVRPGLPASRSSEPVIVSGLPKSQAATIPQREDTVENWDAFWKDVRDKAAR